MRVNLLEKINLDMCIIISLHYGNICKLCIQRNNMCFCWCVLQCKHVQHCVSVEIHLSASSALTIPHAPGYR